MKIIVKSSLLAVLALGAASPAIAQDGEETSDRRPTGGHSKDAFIASYDANGDGEVSLEEFMAERASIHEGYDMDGDGVVTQVEYVDDYRYRLDVELAERRARNLRQAHFRFGVLDSNDDADLTLDELNESGSRTFERLDTNGDGIVNEEDTADAF